MVGTLFNIALLVENDYYPLLIILSFLALAFTKNRRALIISMIVVLLLLPALKGFYQEDRPCKDMLSEVDCKNFEFPTNVYGFPSGHAITAILLPAAALGTYAMFFFLPAAILIAFLRVYLGVHTLNQISAGIALGLVVYFLVLRIDAIIQNKFRKMELIRGSARKEDGRQIIHILGGYLLIGLLLWLGLPGMELLLIGGIVFGMILINMKMLGLKLGPFEFILDDFERREAEFAGRGALLFGIGVLLILSFVYLRNSDFALAMLAIFATGDAFSTIIGRKYGKNKLLWNSRKSWEGMLAFFVTSSVASFPFIGFAGIFFSAILALVETLDIHIDDNLLIPIVCVVLFQLFG
jgi:dolichol kinase